MKKYIVIALIVLVGGTWVYYNFFGGDDPVVIDEKVVPAVFAFEENLATVGDEVAPLKITVTEELSKLELLYNDSLIQSWTDVKEDVSFDLEAGVFGVGTRTITLKSTLKKDGTEYADSRFIRVLSDIIPEKLGVRIVNPYPHNPQSFTQGLEFANGKLYEGTGDPADIGATLVAEVDITTGEHLDSQGLSVGYFGEGITILNNTLYQLTYKNGKCYTYAIDDKIQIRTGEFNYQGEGWGLCNDGTHLIMSNGTERLVFRDPESFTTVRTLDVYNDKGPIVNLNELEYIDGKIYANVWTTNAVIVIDPVSGKVLQEIDATELVRQGRGRGEVLNGIALNKETGKIYMTGKYWEKLFEVQFIPLGGTP